MDSMKQGRRAQKKTQRCRNDLEEDYSDDDDDEDDNLLMNTLKNNPGLLDTSAEATSGITFNSAGGPKRAKGVELMVVSTNQTQDGTPIFIIDPNGVLLESDSSNDNDLTVYAQQHLKALGLPLKQQFMDGEDDVLLCRRTKRVTLLSEFNGILVLKKGKRQASCLTSIKNLKQLIADITNGNASPIVDTKLKYYTPYQRGKRKPNHLEPEHATGRHTKTPTYEHQDFSQGVAGNTRGVAAQTAVVTQPARLTTSFTMAESEPHSEWDGEAILMTTKYAPFTLLHLNMAKLTDEQKARLWHYRLGHPSAATPFSMHKLKLSEDVNCPIVLNEDCPCCIKGKFRVKPFPKRSTYLPETDLQPWEKVYVDGYGGQKSLGTTIGGAKKDLFLSMQ